ncbi:hypothetical protein DSAG12_00628 [Promethearchaeum syntrophicum]|uniref:Uncharacterized protein n=1 Tax=Promethearchaeum syntrophicum TaxID=2594042 RepID=A0A5B9D760_9ARCH|nr:hypothetical protein [Candidatus Prometheoarchaeum syntrophicum]QEE14811.1 hypothetical protein DSAG12_00628 [Candidatus Prometheoarchaeum syntrophicum]
MPNIFKLSKTIVKVIAGIITVAFIFNSVSGLMGSLDFLDGESITPQDLEPGDFKINFNELAIEIGIDIENKGIYDFEGIIIGLTFEIKSNISEVWNVILNTTSDQLNTSISSDGQRIEPGEKESILLNATIDDFALDPNQIAILFGLNASSWDIVELFEVDFEIRMNLRFSIDYAFDQYQLDFDLSLDNDVLKGGFVL